MDMHPITPGRKISTEQRLMEVECRLAELWDQVWWMQVPWLRRFWYWLQGFRAPIKKFYND